MHTTLTQDVRAIIGATVLMVILSPLIAFIAVIAAVFYLFNIDRVFNTL